MVLSRRKGNNPDARPENDPKTNMSQPRPAVTRFAPSPTGYLHLGHAFSALFTLEAARQREGKMLLRIEDIDTTRCKPEFEDAIHEDLAWLGLDWDMPVRRQSDHFDEYRHALDRLEDQGVLYPCFCSRREIRAEIEKSGAAPHDAPPGHPSGQEGPLYPGTCRRLAESDRNRRKDAGDAYALRLNAGEAATQTGPLTWTDAEKGDIEATLDRLGDVVLARKESPASYHLAVTIDDHLQGVSLVTRGEDLFSSTHVHRVLQALLGLDTPEYHHHRLLTGDDGQRFAKRDKSLTIRALREAGHSPAEVIAMTGFKMDEGL